MEKPGFSSRTADKFVVRLPDGMRKAIEDLAIANNSRMNTEMILAVEAHLKSQTHQKLLLDALQGQVNGAKVPTCEQPQKQAESTTSTDVKNDTH